MSPAETDLINTFPTFYFNKKVQSNKFEFLPAGVRLLPFRHQRHLRQLVVGQGAVRVEGLVKVV